MDVSVRLASRGVCALTVGGSSALGLRPGLARAGSTQVRDGCTALAALATSGRALAGTAAGGEVALLLLLLLPALLLALLLPDGSSCSETDVELARVGEAEREGDAARAGRGGTGAAACGVPDAVAA